MATANEPPLLSYALEPKSISVSTPTKPSPGKLEIAAIADTPVYCDGFVIRIPIGTGEEDLTTDKTITARLESDNPSVPDAWPHEERLEENDTILAVHFEPNAAVQISAGTRLTLHIADFDVNEEIGTAHITITELTSPTSSGPYPPRTTSHEVNKTPPGFYLRNLTPDHIAVDNGDSVLLTWETSHGTNYRMYWDDLSEPLSINDTAWRSPALTRTTGFMLQASVNTRSGRALILHTLTTAVTVINADLTARDIAVNGTLDIGNGPGTATTNLGFTTDEHGVRHLPSSMTDGNRDTYYWSALHPKVDDWVMVDLGGERQITKIEIYFGATTGYTLPSCDLEYSTNRTQWHKHTTIPAGRTDYKSGAIAWTARYVHLKMNAAQGHRIAIRSFEITTEPCGATITPTETVIHTPLTTKGAVRIEGDLVVTGEIRVMNKLTAENALEVGENLLAKGHVTVTQPGKVLRVRELRGPVKQGGETVDPPINISKGTITIGTIYGAGPYPTVTIPAHLKLSTPGRTTTINGPVIAKGNVTIDAKSDTQPAADNTLTVGAALIAKSNVTVDPGADGRIWLKTGRFNADGPALFAGKVDGLFPTVTSATWEGTSYSLTVDADMIATVRNESSKKQFINAWSGGNMLFEIGLDAWEVATVPLRKGWTFQKRSPQGGTLYVWRFYVGAKS
ncbi:discoidin domain-containing protein [Streptomyces sp. NPDC048506]|uniref:discoidin domain-containing protein n=1 Tax=Streptomyces sp. NPDC048506 TaxID=3155028 RepID=UPI0034265B43